MHRETGHWPDGETRGVTIAGKRLGPAEIESVIVSHPLVVEAAALGVPDQVSRKKTWGIFAPQESFITPALVRAAALERLMGGA